jgi:flagellin-like hook-associated protein FlgL
MIWNGNYTVILQRSNISSFPINPNQSNVPVNIERLANGNLHFSTNLLVNGAMTALTGTSAGNANSVTLSNGSGAEIVLNFPSTGNPSLADYLGQAGDTYSFNINIDANRVVSIGATTNVSRTDTILTQTNSPFSNLTISGSNTLRIDNDGTTRLEVERTAAGYTFTMEVDGRIFTNTYATMPANVVLSAVGEGTITLGGTAGLTSFLLVNGDKLSADVNYVQHIPPRVEVNDFITATGEGTDDPPQTEWVRKGGPLWIHSGANAGQGILISIGSVAANELGGPPPISEINARTLESCMQALITIDSALATVTSIRATLGAYQNRLEHTSNNLNISTENLSAAKSRIRDADMAMEMVELTKTNVLQQAAMSMLAQSNQTLDAVLQLLR